MQCVAGAMTAGAAATGTRAWIVSHAGAWLTPRRQTLLTRSLIATGIVAAGVLGASAA
jgi:hypothetical protein